MEFLIILFIVISVVSSIIKNTRKHTKSEPTYDPWSFDSELEYEEGKKYLQGKRQQEGKEFFNKEKKPAVEVGLAEKKRNRQETKLTSPLDENLDLHYQEEIKGSITPTYQDSHQKDIKMEKLGKVEKELKNFLTGNKLPLGIVVSEVLGPPRSLKSHSYRKD